MGFNRTRVLHFIKYAIRSYGTLIYSVWIDITQIVFHYQFGEAVKCWMRDIAIWCRGFVCMFNTRHVLLHLKVVCDVILILWSFGALNFYLGIN